VNRLRTWDSGRDNDNVGILECKFGSIVLWKIASDFLYLRSAYAPLLFMDIRTAGEEMWERSAATPGVFTTSYNASSVIRGEVLRRRDNGY
jgi:hypothetical protein